MLTASRGVTAEFPQHGPCAGGAPGVRGGAAGEEGGRRPGWGLQRRAGRSSRPAPTPRPSSTLSLPTGEGEGNAGRPPPLPPAGGGCHPLAEGSSCSTTPASAPALAPWSVTSTGKSPSENTGVAHGEGCPPAGAGLGHGAAAGLGRHMAPPLGVQRPWEPTLSAGGGDPHRCAAAPASRSLGSHSRLHPRPACSRSRQVGARRRAAGGEARLHGTPRAGLRRLPRKLQTPPPPRQAWCSGLAGPRRSEAGAQGWGRPDPCRGPPASAFPHPQAPPAGGGEEEVPRLGGRKE